MKAWRKAERTVAKKIGGRVQPASGALPVAGFKEDVVSDKYLVQVKETAYKQYVLKEKELLTLVQHALHIGKEPVFHLVMRGRSWVMLRAEDWEGCCL